MSGADRDERVWWTIHASILAGGVTKTLATDVLSVDRDGAVRRADEIARGMGGVVCSSLITRRVGDFGTVGAPATPPCTYKVPKMEVDWDDKSVWLPYDETAPEAAGTFKAKEESNDTVAP